jgi:hypothetical protein
MAIGFTLVFRKKMTREATLEWTNTSGRKITIKSPLSRYLKLQRQKDQAAREWNATLANVVAKDFAIIARFGDPTEVTTSDFVIAGIRGLGTWGAAWFLDRRYKELRSVREFGDVQMLLEVTYKSGMIAEVRDVSSEAPEYFALQLSDKFIKELIGDTMRGGPMR